MDTRTWYTGHFWSLSIEEHFYLFWPPMIALLKWRKALWAGIAIVVAEAFWRPWVLMHTVRPDVILQHTDMRLDFLMLGSIFAIASFEWPSFKAWLVKCGTLPVVALSICCLGVSVLHWGFDTRSLQALVLAILVCGTAVSESKVVRALLANRPLLFIGKISYSLYLLQQPFFDRFRNPAFNTPVAELVKIVIVFGLANLSYRYFERPIIGFARRRLKARIEARPAQSLT